MNIKVYDELPLNEVEVVIDYIYENFQDIQRTYLSISKKEGFYSIKSISKWGVPPERLEKLTECKYSVELIYQRTYGLAGDQLCIAIVVVNGVNKFKVFTNFHWSD